MATLCMDIGSEVGTTPELRDWLDGNWGMLFSHPQDFQYQGLEPDRRLDILRGEFRDCGVRPIAVRRDGGMRDMSWVGELQSDWDLIRVREPAFTDADAVSFHARALREELLTLQPRFVVIVDGSLKHRGALTYSVGRCNASLHDLLASIDAMRRFGRTRNAA